MTKLSSDPELLENANELFRGLKDRYPDSPAKGVTVLSHALAALIYNTDDIGEDGRPIEHISITRAVHAHEQTLMVLRDLEDLSRRGR